MPTYTNILVPTDGSKAAKRATRHAVDLAKVDGATVYALYVMDVGDAAFVATPSDIKETRQRLERKGREYTDDVRRAADEAGVECVTAVKPGIPAEVLREYVADNDIDLVVMGRRGRSDPDKPLLGSLTRRVLGESDVPVHTV